MAPGPPAAFAGEADAGETGQDAPANTTAANAAIAAPDRVAVTARLAFPALDTTALDTTALDTTALDMTAPLRSGVLRATLPDWLAMPSASGTRPPATSRRRPPRRRIGLWPLAVSAAAIAAGTFAGQLWVPLGLFVAAVVGAALAGVIEAAVGVLGTAVGVPVLRSVGSTILHSPIYLPAAAFGLLLGLGLRWWALRPSREPDDRNATTAPRR